MNITSVIARAAVLAVLGSASVGGSAALAIQTDAASDTAAVGRAAERIIIEYEPWTDSEDRKSARADAHTSLITNLGNRRFQLLAPGPNRSAAESVAELRADPAIRVAVPDAFDAPAALPDDPLFGSQWGLRNLGTTPGVRGFALPLAGADIDALAAWSRTVGSPATVVADIDTGYRFDHPDLAAAAWSNSRELPSNGIDDDANGYVDDARGYDFVGHNADSPTADADPSDSDMKSGGHGTHTAGTIGATADNGIGVAGVARTARLMPLRVCSRSPSAGKSLCPQSATIAAINYAGANGARVANMSIVGTAFNPAVRDALAANPGTLYVAAAGNDSVDTSTSPRYPCNYHPPSAVPAVPGAVDNVVCVAASDQADTLAAFSNRSREFVDLGAPGTEILSTYPWRRWMSDDFETGDFYAKWEATGPAGGFGPSSEEPLSSAGMTDSPGQTPAGDTVKETTSRAVELPAGVEYCVLEQARHLYLSSGDSYTYTVLLGGTPIGTWSGSGSGTYTVPVTGSSLTSGGDLRVRFRYETGGSPGPTNGVWLDNIKFRCSEPPGQASGYEYRQGTSMAAPHVTGTAALLFSLKPTATVTEVRDALIAGVDRIPALIDQTVSGGRANASKSLDALLPQDFPRSINPLPPTTPRPPSESLTPSSSAPPARDPTRCIVPKVTGASPNKAKARIRRAHCKPGFVERNRSARGRRRSSLVVRSSRPAAGAIREPGSIVNLRVGPRRVASPT